MAVSKSYDYFSPQDYLEGERVSPIKHEYRQGEIYAMAGVIDDLSTITSKVRAGGLCLYSRDF